MARLRRALKKRAFLRQNPEIRRVLAEGDRELDNLPCVKEPLSTADVDHWQKFGFLILKGFFDQETISRYRKHIDDTWETRAHPKNPLVIYATQGLQHFRDAKDDDRQQPYRLLDQYLVDDPTCDLCAHPRLTAILSQLMGHTPVVCNSILFEWGSEQELHSDMFYMPPVTQNQMLASWIAIDDVTEDNGPLVYVPGSHRLPPHRFSNGQVHAVTEEVSAAVDAIKTRMSDLGLRTEKFFAQSGDVLIWHSQLMHGGDVIRDRSVRRTSLVTHYYSTCDVPKGLVLCAESKDGSLLLVKKHLQVA